jgi:hypothetical protein
VSKKIVQGIFQWFPQLNELYDEESLHEVLFSVYTNAWGCKPNYKKGREEVGLAVVRTLTECGIAGTDGEHIASLVKWFYQTKAGKSKSEAVQYEVRHWVSPFMLGPLDLPRLSTSF